MALNNRYDFVMIFDVENGNPNGDPDAGNAPRMDVESGLGYVTDVCLKRKIRNYVELVKEGVPGYNILIKPREYICKNYFDVRAFGAVMSTGDDPCGIVRGPVQINFARSISPINALDITITRQAKTSEVRNQKSGDTEMGRKSIIPYALYRAEGYVSAALANKSTGLTEEDVELLWTSIINMFENDHSAARGKMCMRKLYVFKHDNVLGSCPSHILFDKITIQEKEGRIPRSLEDYVIQVDNNMPQGVEMIEKL